MEVCSAVMEDLLASLPLEGEVSSTVVGMETEVEPVEGDMEGEKGEEEREVEGEREGEELRPVSEEERETDRNIRLRIYLALLNLACAMVRE